MSLLLFGKTLNNTPFRLATHRVLLSYVAPDRAIRARIALDRIGLNQIESEMTRNKMYLLQRLPETPGDYQTDLLCLPDHPRNPSGGATFSAIS